MVQLNETQKGLIAGSINDAVASIVDSSFKSFKENKTKEAINFAYKWLLKPYKQTFEEVKRNIEELEYEFVYKYKESTSCLPFFHKKRPKGYENLLAITKPVKTIARLCAAEEDMLRELTLDKLGEKKEISEYQETVMAMVSDSYGKFLNDFYNLIIIKGKTPEQLKQTAKELVAKLDLSAENSYFSDKQTNKSIGQSL